MICPKYRGRPNALYRINRFITPYDSHVKETSLIINKGNHRILFNSFNFVSEKIIYMKDIVSYGRKEYWAFPKETIIRRIGDCEDKSFLLASLILATGVDYRDIRVVLGKNRGEGHAWVEAKSIGSWYILEPTSGSPLKIGVNTWEIQVGYRIGYSPDIYIYYKYCQRITNRNI